MPFLLALVGLLMILVGVSRMPQSWEEVKRRTNGPGAAGDPPVFSTDWSMALIGPLVCGGVMTLCFSLVLSVVGH